MQAFVRAQIAKYRLHRRKAARDPFLAFFRIDFRLHRLDMTFGLIAHPLEERNLPRLRFPGRAQTFIAALARPTILFGPAELHHPVAVDGAIRAIAIELTGWRSAAFAHPC